MATPQQLRERVAQLVREASGDLDLIWSQVAGSTDLTAALFDLMPALIDTYGPAIAVVAADWYDDAREERSVRGAFRAIPAGNPDPGASALIGWAQSEATGEDALKSLILGGMQKRLANFSRDTIIRSSVSDPQATGWMRTARSGGCRFCRMLAGRGAVYRESTVHFGAHDHCNCQAAPAWGGKPDVFDVREYRRSTRHANEESSEADNARARDWIAANL